MKLGFFSSMVTDGNPTTGYEIANEAIVDGLRALGHDVTVIGFQLPRQQGKIEGHVRVLDSVNLENANSGKLKKLEWVVRSFLKSLPMAAGKLTSYPASKLAEVIESAGPFDAHIINSYQMAAAFPQLLEKPYAYVAHNVEHQSASENAVSAGSGVERYLYQRDAKLLKRLETHLCQGAEFVWTLSDDDLASFKPVMKSGSVLPLIAPVVEVSAKPVPKQWDIGMIGTWGWQPNFVGLEWFLDKVVPLLPDTMKIAVAGSLPSGVAPSTDKVEFLGRVPDAAEFLSAVRVIPLVSQGGTGVQLKTIEAFQAGYACVATQSSVRGIDQLPENCRQADDPQSFADGLVELVDLSVNNTDQNLDGSAFYKRQKAVMVGCLEQGIAALTV